MNACTQCSTAPQSHLDLEGVFDALVGWGDVEKALDLSESERWSMRFRGGYESVRNDERLLLRAMRHPRARLRIIATEAGRAWPSVLSVALRDPYWRVRATAAASKAAPPELLAELADDPSPETRRTAVLNENMPVSAVVQLLDDRELEVRLAAAEHPSVPLAELLRLSHDSEWKIRRTVATRAVPSAWLDRLANDPELAVAAAVATNAGASPDALRVISQRTTSNATLAAIAEHPNAWVEDAVAVVSKMTDWWEVQRLARRTVRPEVMVTFAGSPVAATREALLDNENLTAEVLALLPLDAAVAEHRATVRHPGATWETCRRLAAHYLASHHYGRRNIGAEFVRVGLTRPGVPVDVPTDVLDGSAGRVDLLQFVSKGA